MLWLLLLQISTLWSPPYACAQTEFNDKWSFEFTNGNRVYFIPSKGVYFHVKDSEYADRVLQDKITQFETTEIEISPKQRFIAQQDGAVRAHLSQAQKGSLTFFVSSKWVYALSQSGRLQPVIETKKVTLPNGRHYVDPLAEIMLPQGTQVKGLAIRHETASDGYTARLYLMDANFTTQSINLNQLPDTNLSFGYTQKKGLKGENILTLMIDSENGGVVRSMFSRSWKQDLAFEEYESFVKGFEKLLEGSSHFVLQKPKVGEWTLAQYQEAEKVLESLYLETSKSGLPSRLTIARSLIPILVSLGTAESRVGKIAGVVKYVPIRDHARESEILHWIGEAHEMQDLTKIYSYLLIHEVQGQPAITFHPVGTGASLQATLSDCNLIFD